MSNNTKLATAPQTATNYILKATSTTLGNSLAYDDGSGIAIGDTTASGYKLKVNGTGNFTGALSGTSATFSSSVTAAGVSISSGNSTQLTITNTEAWANGSIADIRGHNVIAITQLRSGTTNGFYVGAIAGNIVGIQGADQSNNAVNISLNPFGGNVGIGTSSPSHKLTIQGASDSGLIITNSSGATRILLSPSGSQHGEFALYNNSGSATTYLGGNGASNYLQAQGGNVGIGTSSPQQYISGTETALHIRNLNAASINLTSDNGRTYIMSSIGNGSLIFYDVSGGSERMRIAPGGNLLIGTTSDNGDKLQVNGGARIQGAVYRYNGQTTIGGSYTNLTSIDVSSARTYLLQVISVNSEASTNYRWFGVIQWNSASSSYAITPLASQTMDVTFSGTIIQIKTSNGQQYTFAWSITQLL